MPACTACTDMVYSKELERDLTTTAMAKAILHLKTLHHSFIEHDRFDFLTSEAGIRAVMYMPCVKCSCSELKTSAYFLRFDIKLKKFRSWFDLVTILFSKQILFQHSIWPV